MARNKIANIKGDKGDKGDTVVGPPGRDGVNGLENDAANAGYINTTGTTDTKTALSDAFGIYAPAPTGDVATDTTLLQALMDEAQATNGTLHLQAGTYRVSNLSTQQLAVQPKIVGKGSGVTFIEGTTAGAALTFVGALAEFSGGYLSDLSFTGVGIGLELQGVVDVDWDRLIFQGNLDVGILFHNKTATEFTEYCAGQAHFHRGVKVAVEYRNTGGVASFHGSGLTGMSTINTPLTPGPSIIIGADCFPYNSPLSVQVWAYAEDEPIIRNDSTEPLNFFGTLRMESFVSGTVVVVDNASAGYVNLAGGITVVSPGVELGKLRIVDRIHNLSDGTLYYSAHDQIEKAEAAYVPTLAGVTVGDGAVVATYSKIGKRVTGRFEFTLGSTSAITDAISFSLPVPFSGGTARLVSDGYLSDSGVGLFTSDAIFGSEGIIVGFVDTSGPAARFGWTGAGAPFTWTAGDQVAVSFEYEAA